MIETETLKIAPSNEAPPPIAPAKAARKPALAWILTLAAILAGLVLRIVPSAGWQHTGFDEAIYRENVIKLDRVGLANYPDICEVFLEDQRKSESMAKLPPTRFTYVFAGWLWKKAEFGDAPPAPRGTVNLAAHDPAMASLHRVSCLFSCLGLVLCAGFAWRVLGLGWTPAITALIAFSPMQIHFAQHALIDGVFTFWAMLNLWLLWENLRHPNHAGLLAVFGASLAVMVMTKENSFFVYLGLAGLLLANRWMKFGEITPRLLMVGAVGPAVGLCALIALAGGVHSFIEIYRLLVTKAETLTYAIQTGDGPWYRYLVDLLLISPLVLILAIGGLFTQIRRRPIFGYFVVFMTVTYAIMCNIRYGMNLRYASIWDFPLRSLAALQVGALARRFGSYHAIAGVCMVAGLCAYDLHQYQVYFADGRLYELVTGGLLQVVKILK